MGGSEWYGASRLICVSLHHSENTRERREVARACAQMQKWLLMPRMQRALISVTDKTGIVDFAGALSALDFEILSTGGTYRVLKAAGIQPLREVAEVTEFPEMLDGRVKTIHPRIAGGVLAMRSKPEHMRSLAEHGIPTIDLVCVNLYEFEKVAAKADVPLHELIENIDIGGPTMIRAAAKNYQDVAVVTSPGDYAGIVEELRSRGGSLSPETHWRLAKKAFATTAAYDRAVTARLAEIPPRGEPLPAILDVRAPRKLALRYGENPHQSAALYADGHAGIAGAEQLQGKELSYNNLVDLDAAWQLIAEFDGPASAIIKHTNPCGCAEGKELAESYRRAFEADPVSAFGGVLAFNRRLDGETAAEIAKTFIEAIAAPGYEEEALTILGSKKNLRLLDVKPAPAELVVKSISGGFLAQTPDLHRLTRAEIQVKTSRAPSEEEWAALEFGWKVAKHVKSNAIVYARPGQTISVGAGQMSRVDSVKVGAMKAVLPLRGGVIASDAFFPFPDGVEEAAKHGITAVIQPGGSVRDADVIAAADRLGLAMVFTGVRHFRH
jgi:phosphoribosylaminoimidazolecarboxamide formyltransferase / IMP cyclohydrolase